MNKTPHPTTSDSRPSETERSELVARLDGKRLGRYRSFRVSKRRNGYEAIDEIRGEKVDLRFLANVSDLDLEKLRARAAVQHVCLERCLDVLEDSLFEDPSPETPVAEALQTDTSKQKALQRDAWVVLEGLAGETLASRMATHAPSFVELVNQVHQLVSATAVIHAQQMQHGSISLDSLWIDNRDHLTLVNWVDRSPNVDDLQAIVDVAETLRVAIKEGQSSESDREAAQDLVRTISTTLASGFREDGTAATGVNRLVHLATQLESIASERNISLSLTPLRDEPLIQPMQAEAPSDLSKNQMKVVIWIIAGTAILALAAYFFAK